MMNTRKFWQNQLLDVLRGTLGEFKAQGIEVALTYKEGCITATVNATICEKCQQIHDGLCPDKKRGFQ
jgi:hypothetical protein